MKKQIVNNLAAFVQAYYEGTLNMDEKFEIVIEEKQESFLVSIEEIELYFSIRIDPDDAYASHMGETQEIKFSCMDAYAVGLLVRIAAKAR